MKIVRSRVEKLTIATLSLDPINVIFEDPSPGCGKTTIEVSGKCWCHYWGDLGKCKMEQFFRNSSIEYLTEKFAGADTPKMVENRSVPMKENPKYIYLERIVQIIKKALAVDRTIGGFSTPSELEKFETNGGVSTGQEM